MSIRRNPLGIPIPFFASLTDESATSSNSASLRKGVLSCHLDIGGSGD
jgi:hypothetical protein